MRQISRHIPEGSEVIAFPGIPATVYAYTSKKDGSPAAIAYTGNSGKPAWHFRFSTEAQRRIRIDEFFTNIAYHAQQVKARHVERVSFRHGYKPGDIVYASWGYDQTNIDYYQITSTTEKTVTFREIAQNREYDGRYMAGTCTPRPGVFLPEAEAETRTVQPPYDGKGKGSIPYARHSLREWDGRALGYSDYA